MAELLACATMQDVLLSASLTREASTRESLEHRMKLSCETHNEREPIRQRYATLVKVGWNRAATCIRDHE